MKRQVMTTIDSEVHAQIKAKGLNVSEIAENALREELDLQKIEIKTKIDHCEFCGRKEKQAEPNDPHHGLTWLWPDEKWMCDSCMRRKGKNITK